MSEEIPKVVPPVVTAAEPQSPVVENNDIVNVVPPAIATAPEVTSPTAGPGVTTAAPGAATEIISDAMMIEYFKSKDPLALKFLEKLKNTMSRVDFFLDDSWLEHAINGLDKPNIDDRIRAQTETFVKKDLRNKAAEAVEAGNAYVAPTAADIAKEVERKIKNRQDDLKSKQTRKLVAAKAALAKK